MTAQTEALRKLADFIDAHPELSFGPGLTEASVYVQNDELSIFAPYAGTPAEQKAFTRKTLRALGGTWAKDPSGTAMRFTRKSVLGFFDVTLYVDREAVCERKLVGMEDIEVPAQKAVKAHIESVPVYEWECGSLLAPTAPERELVDAL